MAGFNLITEVVIKHLANFRLLGLLPTAEEVLRKHPANASIGCVCFD